MDKEKIKQRIAELKKTLAKKEKKLEKSQRHQRRKAHIQQKLLEQEDIYTNEQSGNTVPADVNGSCNSKESVFCAGKDSSAQTYRTEHVARKTSVTFQLDTDACHTLPEKNTKPIKDNVDVDDKTHKTEAVESCKPDREHTQQEVSICQTSVKLPDIDDAKLTAPKFTTEDGSSGGERNRVDCYQVREPSVARVEGLFIEIPSQTVTEKTLVKEKWNAPKSTEEQKSPKPTKWSQEATTSKLVTPVLDLTPGDPDVISGSPDLYSEIKHRRSSRQTGRLSLPANLTRSAFINDMLDESVISGSVSILGSSLLTTGIKRGARRDRGTSRGKKIGRKRGNSRSCCQDTHGDNGTDSNTEATNMSQFSDTAENNPSNKLRSSVENSTEQTLSEDITCCDKGSKQSETFPGELVNYPNNNVKPAPDFSNKDTLVPSTPFVSSADCTKPNNVSCFVPETQLPDSGTANSNITSQQTQDIVEEVASMVRGKVSKANKARKRYSDAALLDFSYLDDDSGDMYSQIKTRRRSSRARGANSNFTEFSQELLQSQSQEDVSLQSELSFSKENVKQDSGKLLEMPKWTEGLSQELSKVEQTQLVRKCKGKGRRKKTIASCSNEDIASSQASTYSLPGLMKIGEDLKKSPVIYFSLPDEDFGKLKLAKAMKRFTSPHNKPRASNMEVKSSNLNQDSDFTEDSYTGTSKLKRRLSKEGVRKGREKKKTLIRGERTKKDSSEKETQNDIVSPVPVHETESVGAGSSCDLQNTEKICNSTKLPTGDLGVLISQQPAPCLSHSQQSPHITQIAQGQTQESKELTNTAVVTSYDQHEDSDTRSSNVRPADASPFKKLSVLDEQALTHSVTQGATLSPAATLQLTSEGSELFAIDCMDLHTPHTGHVHLLVAASASFIYVYHLALGANSTQIDAELIQTFSASGAAEFDQKEEIKDVKLLAHTEPPSVCVIMESEDTSSVFLLHLRHSPAALPHDPWLLLHRGRRFFQDHSLPCCPLGTNSVCFPTVDTDTPMTQVCSIMFEEIAAGSRLQIKGRNYLEAVGGRIHTLVRIQGCPDALLGMTEHNIYIWDHRVRTLLQTVCVSVKHQSCPCAIDQGGYIFLPLLAWSKHSAGCLMVVNPLTASTAVINQLDLPQLSNNQEKYSSSLLLHEEYLCGLTAEGRLCMWHLYSGRLCGMAAVGERVMGIASIEGPTPRLLLTCGTGIQVYDPPHSGKVLNS